jgi:hypothetical protein
MKKGIILFATLGFVAAMFAIFYYVFDLSDILFAKSRQIQARDQKIIIFQDIKKALDDYAADIKNSDDLSKFLSTPLFFSDKKTALSMQVEISSLSNKLNVNDMMHNNKINSNKKDLFEQICDTYNVIDTDFLVSLVLDTIDDDTNERVAGSEIALENFKFTNGSIADFDQFETILESYTRYTNDSSVKIIPWKKLIYFGRQSSGFIDCDRLSNDMIFAIGLDESYKSCDDLQNETGKNMKEKFDLKKYDKEDVYIVSVKIRYKIQGTNTQRISFEYDIKTHKVSDFDF